MGTELHNTENKEIELTRKYSQEPYQIKPNGLWTCPDQSWIHRCKEIELPVQPYLHWVRFDPKEILVLDSMRTVKEFTEKYNLENSCYNWEEIAKKHKGIQFRNVYRVKSQVEFSHEIELRKVIFWFLLDVDSACIWDLSALKGTGCLVKPLDCNCLQPIPKGKV